MVTDGKSLVERASGVIAQYQHDELDAYQDLLPDEMVIPVVKLVQGVSRDVDTKKVGDFFNTVTKEYKPDLRVAVLALKRSRSLFGESFDEPPICSSDDAIKPREIVEVGADMTGPDCATCPFSQWGTAREGKGKGQACRMAYNLLCMDLDDFSVFVVRVTGASIQDFRKYMSAGKMQKRPAYSQETVISSLQKTFDVGQAYVLVFRTGEALEPQLAEQMREAAANYRGIDLGVEGEDADIDLVAADIEGDPFE